jgi:hypothetical protein
VAEFLAIQIRLGKITIDDVPEKYRAEVEEILNSKFTLGLICELNILA